MWVSAKMARAHYVASSSKSNGWIATSHLAGERGNDNFLEHSRHVIFHHLSRKWDRDDDTDLMINLKACNGAQRNCLQYIDYQNCNYHLVTLSPRGKLWWLLRKQAIKYIWDAGSHHIQKGAAVGRINQKTHSMFPGSVKRIHVLWHTC